MLYPLDSVILLFSGVYPKEITNKHMKMYVKQSCSQRFVTGGGMRTENKVRITIRTLTKTFLNREFWLTETETEESRNSCCITNYFKYVDLKKA